MQIDWLTVGAQIVNFLILVWLLKRFLYKPVIAAMERREAAVAERLASAAAREAEAQARAEALAAERAVLDGEAAAMLAEARESAAAERAHLGEAARAEVAARERQWNDQLVHQRTAFLDALRAEASRQFSALARRALSDLADADLESRIVAVFIRRLASLGEDDRSTLAAAADGDGALVVASRFPLAPADKQRLTRSLHRLLGTEANVTHAVDDGLVCGIELRAGSRHLGWSIARYLDDLEAEVAATLDSTSAAVEGAEGTPETTPPEAMAPATTPAEAAPSDSAEAAAAADEAATPDARPGPSSGGSAAPRSPATDAEAPAAAEAEGGPTRVAT